MNISIHKVNKRYRQKLLTLLGGGMALSLISMSAVSAVNSQHDISKHKDSSNTQIPQLVLLSVPKPPIVLAQADTGFSLEFLVDKALNNEPLEPTATDNQEAPGSKTLEELVDIASSSPHGETSSDYISKLNSEVKTTVVINPETAQKPASIVKDMSDAEKLKILDKINQTIAQDNKQTTSNVRYIKVRENDSLWLIAEREYGDPYQYKILYQANKDLLSNENSLVVGQKIRIPQLSEND